MFRGLILLPLISAVIAAQTVAATPDAVSAAMDSGDYEAARELLKPLAIEGDAEAQYTLGMLYLDGHGGAEKESTGVHWLTLSARQHYHKAANELGKMYASGRGVPMDQELSQKWYSYAGKVAEEQGKKEEECE